MQDNVRRQGATTHRSGSSATTHRSGSSSLAAVSLPARPGVAQRLRPPTPPPRPESTLRASPGLLAASIESPAALGRLAFSSSQASPPQPLRPLLPLPSMLTLSDPSAAVVAGVSAPQAAAVISLTSPRTPAVRQQNLYVEAPVKKKGPPLQQQQPPPLGGGSLRLSPSCQSVQSAVNSNNNNKQQQRPGRLGIAATTTTHSSKPTALHHHHASSLPSSSSSSTSVIISQQPPPLGVCPIGGGGGGTLKKGSGPDSPPPSLSMTTLSGASSPTSSSSSSDSIICGVCGRCRCAACRSPRPLPSAWLCDNSCLCSPESVVDMVSCMCCVKAGLYHCGEGLEEEASWVDSPCSCTPNQWLLRWGCLAAMALPLPCLLCYPLLGGLTRLAETCYQRATRQGCRCPAAAQTPTTLAAASPGADSQKRLLG